MQQERAAISSGSPEHSIREAMNTSDRKPGATREGETLSLAFLDEAAKDRTYRDL